MSCQLIEMLIKHFVCHDKSCKPGKKQSRPCREYSYCVKKPEHISTSKPCNFTISLSDDEYNQHHSKQQLLLINTEMVTSFLRSRAQRTGSRRPRHLGSPIGTGDQLGAKKNRDSTFLRRRSAQKTDRSLTGRHAHGSRNQLAMSTSPFIRQFLRGFWGNNWNPTGDNDMYNQVGEWEIGVASG